MEKLKRLIGPAPSELSHEDLVRKIRSRQEFVAGMLSEFRERMAGKRSSGKGSSKKGPSKKAETKSLKALMAEMQELGVSLEDLKKIARGKQ